MAAALNLCRNISGVAQDEHDDWRSDCPTCGAHATLVGRESGGGNGGDKLVMGCRNGHRWDVREFEFSDEHGERWRPLPE